MLIGNSLAENKIYRGIKHYDKLPLTSRDIHEDADTLYTKNKILLNQILGSGILNNPELSISSTGVSLLSPAALLLDGDISLIQSDDEILKVSDITSSGIMDGVLCIIGWYQSLNHQSTLRSYGGVRNAILPNDLVDSDLNIQVSTRYQLRWDTVLIDSALFGSASNSISIDITSRDAAGDPLGGVSSITTMSRIGDIRVASKLPSMNYVVSDLYVIPLIHYVYSGEFTQLMLQSPLSVRGVSTRNSIQKYMNTVIIDTESTQLVDTQVSIGIDSYSSDDLLQVVYNGVSLDEGRHYTVSNDLKYITLKEFATKVGDEVTLTVIKNVSYT